MLELVQVLADGRRHIYSNGKDLEVEIGVIEHTHGAYSIMERMVKRGFVDHFMEKTLSINTYYTDEKGRCYSRFNPGIKQGGYSGSVLDPDWLLEATEENERKIIAEIERRYSEEV